MSRKDLNLDLTGFAPRPPQPAPELAVKRELDTGAGWPSREAPEPLIQLNIRAPASVSQRFRDLCERQGRRTYPEMLEILMDEFEKGRG